MPVTVNLFIGHLEATVSNEVLLASFHQSLGCYINQNFCTKRKYFIIQKDLVMKLRLACLSKYFLRESIPIKIMKIFSFFAANIKYGGGIVSHLPLCLSSIRRSHVILMVGENNLLLVSFILNLSNRIWSTLPKPLPFSRITVLMYFLGVSVPQCLQ